LAVEKYWWRGQMRCAERDDVAYKEHIEGWVGCLVLIEWEAGIARDE
jgi:hypothetical protein